MDDSFSTPADGPPHKPWPEILTPHQVATYLQRSIKTIYKWVYLNKIPHTKKCGLRFIKADIDRWLKGR